MCAFWKGYTALIDWKRRYKVYLRRKVGRKVYKKSTYTYAYSADQARRFVKHKHKGYTVTQVKLD